MTIIYYGVNPHDGGPDAVAVSVGSTTGKAIEVAIDNTKITNESGVHQALKRIMVGIQQKRLTTT